MTKIHLGRIAVRPRAWLLGLVPASGLVVMAGGCGDEPEAGGQAPQALVDDYDASLRAAQDNASSERAAKLKKKAP